MNRNLANATKPRNPRWYGPTPAKFLFAVLVMQGVLFLSAHYRWFWFNDRKGYTVLIAVAATAIALLLLFTAVLASRFFKSNAQFSLSTLLLVIPVIAIPCGWVSRHLHRARQQSATLEALKSSAPTAWVYDDPWFDMSGNMAPPSASYAWLESRLGRDFLCDVVFLQLSRPKDADLEMVRLFEQLKTLSLAGDQMTNAGLAHLEGLKDLQCARIDGPHITDEGLKSLGKLKQLDTLTMKNTRITDKGLAHLQGLVKLKSLDIEDTPITGSGLAHLEALFELEIVRFNRTCLTDKALSHLKNCHKLTHVLLRSTSISDAGLWHLKTHSQIEFLYVDHTNVTDAGIASLKNIKQLRTLDVAGTRVTDAALPHLTGNAQL